MYISFSSWLRRSESYYRLNSVLSPFVKRFTCLIVPVAFNHLTAFLYSTLQSTLSTYIISSSTTLKEIGGSDNEDLLRTDNRAAVRYHIKSTGERKCPCKKPNFVLNLQNREWRYRQEACKKPNFILNSQNREWRYRQEACKKPNFVLNSQNREWRYRQEACKKPNFVLNSQNREWRYRQEACKKPNFVLNSQNREWRYHQEACKKPTFVLNSTE